MDAYDKAVIYFKKNPKRIYSSWDSPSDYKYGFLFSYADISRNKAIACATVDIDYNEEKKQTGCPSLIHGSDFLKEIGLSKITFVGQTEKITKLCKESDLPNDMEILAKNNPSEAATYLEEFARVQRLIDKELKVKPPKL